MRRIVIDIETCAYSFDSLAESQKEYLLRYADKETNYEKKEAMTNDAIRYTSLYPYTAKCIAIGIFDIEKEQSYVYYERDSAAGEEEWKSEDESVHYKGLSEKEMLESFWRVVAAADQIITFNGRNFDVPFLMIRAAMLKVNVTKNLLGNRFGHEHIDLLEKLTFYGGTRKFNLDFYCNAFRIESPKTAKVSGMEVKNLYEAGRIKDIAVYCAKDIYATYQLFKIWDEYLNIK